MDVDDDGWDLRELELAKQQSLNDSMEHNAPIAPSVNPKKRPKEPEAEEVVNAKRFAPLAPEDESMFTPTRSSSSFGHLASNRPPESPSHLSKVEKNRLQTSNDKFVSSSIQAGTSSLHLYSDDAVKSSPKQSETPSTPDSSDWSSTTLGLYESSNEGSSINSSKKKRQTSDDEFNRQWEAALAQASAPGQSPEDEAESQRRLNEFLDRLQEKMDRDMAMDLQKSEAEITPREEIPVSKPSMKPAALYLAAQFNDDGPAEKMDVDAQTVDHRDERNPVTQPNTSSGFARNASPANIQEAVSEGMDADMLTMDESDDMDVEQPKTPPELMPLVDPRTPSTPEECVYEDQKNAIPSESIDDNARASLFDAHFKILQQLAKKAVKSSNLESETTFSEYQAKLDQFLGKEPASGTLLSSSTTGLPSSSSATQALVPATVDKNTPRNQLTSSGTLRSSRIISEDEEDPLSVPTPLIKRTAAAQGGISQQMDVANESNGPASATSSISAVATSSPIKSRVSSSRDDLKNSTSSDTAAASKERDKGKQKTAPAPASTSMSSPRNAEANPSETAPGDVPKQHRWTTEEEETLLQSAKANSHIRNGKYYFRWKDIEKDLPWRTASSISQHFTKLRAKGSVPWLTDINTAANKTRGALAVDLPGSGQGPKEKEKAVDTATTLPSAPTSTTAAAKKTSAPSTPRETPTTSSSKAVAASSATSKNAASSPPSALLAVLTSSEASPSAQAPVVSGIMSMTTEQPKETQSTQTPAPTAPEPEVRATPAQDALYEDEWEVF